MTKDMSISSLCDLEADGPGVVLVGFSGLWDSRTLIGVGTDEGVGAAKMEIELLNIG